MITVEHKYDHSIITILDNNGNSALPSLVKGVTNATPVP